MILNTGHNTTAIDEAIKLLQQVKAGSGLVPADALVMKSNTPAKHCEEKHNKVMLNIEKHLPGFISFTKTVDK